jgi:hypothetical protein
MTDPQLTEDTSIIAAKTEVSSLISIDELKSFFYLYNAKPDTEIRLLKEKKIVELSDIISLRERVSHKLENHSIIGQTTSISFTLSNNKIKEFATWPEFERTNWYIVNERIESLNMSWNILIQLPQHKSPQTHSMKLKVGNSILPKDIFQLILTSDNISELMEAGSPGVCKVDFINTIVANELLSIVDEWYQGLQKPPESDFIQKFIKKDGKTVSQIIRLLFPLILLIFICVYSDWLYPIFGISQQLSISTIQSILVVFLAVYVFGSSLGRMVEKFIDERIDKIVEHPSFLITKGDKNFSQEFSRNNTKLVWQISYRLAWIMFGAFVSVIGKLLIDSH